MDPIELSRIVNHIARSYMETQTPGYFDCLEALDALEFNVLDFMDEGSTSREMEISTLR